MIYKWVVMIIILIFLLSILFVIDYRLLLFYPEILQIRGLILLLFYVYSLYLFLFKKIKLSKKTIVTLFTFFILTQKDTILFLFGNLSYGSFKMSIQFFINLFCLSLIVNSRMFNLSNLFKIYFYFGIIALLFNYITNFDIINPNTVMFCYIPFIVTNFNRLKGKYFLLVVIIIIAHMFEARNVIIMLFIFIIFNTIKIKSKITYICIFLFSIFLAVSTLYITDYNLYNFIDDILTRRLFIWNFYFNDLNSTPVSYLWGKGIVERELMFDLGSIFNTFRPYNIHNTYFTYFYENGLISLIIIIIFIITLNRKKDKFYSLLFIICIYINIETIHLGDLNIVSIIFSLCLFQLLKEEKEESSCEEKNIIFRK